MWNVAKCLGARNGPTPPTHTCHPLSIYPSLLLRLLTWQFFLFFFTVRHRQFCLSDIFNARPIYPEHFLRLHASEWKLIIYKPSEHASISLSFSSFLSLPPRSFFFLGMILLCVQAKRMTFNQAGNGFVLFCQSKPCVCVCVCVSVRIEIDIHPQVIRERKRDGTWLQGSIGQTVTL